MKTAEIFTAQHVAIRYDLAPLRDRVFAFIIDLLINIFLFWIMRLLFGSLARWVDPLYLLFTLIPSFLFSTYSLLSEIFLKGQTAGKMVLGLRVIKLNGKEASTGDFVTRWIFRVIDIWFSIGAVGAMMIGTTPRGQRLGDLLSETIVIRLRPHSAVELSQLLKMHQDTAESVEFEMVTQYTEQDMLMAMSALDRYRRYPNKTNQSILSELVHRMKQELGAEKNSYTDEKFVRKIIRDYVSLTR